MSVRSLIVLCGSFVLWSATAVGGLAQQASAAPVWQVEKNVAPPAAQGPQGRARPPLERTVSVELTSVRLDSALDAIGARAGIVIVYTDRVVPVGRRVSVKLSNVTVRQALEKVLEGTNVEVRARGDEVVLVRRPERRTEAVGEGAVWGRVIDSATARPLAGAVVSVEGTTIRYTTTDSGYYALVNVPAGVQVISAKYLGYTPAQQQIAVADSQRVRLDFTLRMGMSRLQEMVTTATGQKRRLEVGSDVTVIDAEAIMATEPIGSVTDLLEGRVPGLVLQRTSGAPGDPARLRLRGASSVYRSNDPIVVVDGIRIYSEQSAERSANLAQRRSSVNTGAYAAPSPLDYMDPASIATIEVVKGPSAATLYGPDAANGVIVITTKKGRSGPPRWTFSAEQGRSGMVANFPDRLLRWGSAAGTNMMIPCPISGDYGGIYVCQADSLASFQMLSDPELSVLDRGQRSALSLGVSGGGQALQYAFTGSYSDETGILRLPAYEVERYREQYAHEPPGWMRRPQQHTQWGGTGRLTTQLGTKAELSVTSSYSRTAQQRSSLEGQLAGLMNTYVDRATGVYYQANTANLVNPVANVLAAYGERVNAASTQFNNAVNATWRPLGWLTTSADVGLNTIQRADQVYVPRGQSVYVLSDTGGYVSLGTGSSVVSTVNLRTTATAPLPREWRFQLATGVNYTGNSISDLTVSSSNLRPGTSSPNQAGKVEQLHERREESATFGVYVEPSLSHRRFWLSTGIRMDGGSTYGSNVSLPRFPKVSASYLLSDEPFFPFKGVIDLLRLRVGYGQAGMHPGPTDRLRVYTQNYQWLDGRYVESGSLRSVGNTQLRPERSTELEGGFEAELLSQRLSLSVTGYRTTKDDALMLVPLPPSVYGSDVSILRNIGVIRNTGVELSLGTELLRTRMVSFNTQLSVSHQRNMVTRLGAGVEPFYTDPSIRVAPGYPLYGRWVKPILGYSDTNENGVIEASEVVLGDTAVYVGSTLPNYTAALHTTATFLSGALSVTAGLTYDDGLNQRNGAVRAAAFSRGWNDPTAPWSEQAAMAVLDKTDYGLLQTVSTLRFNSLSVNYHLPRTAAARLGASSATVALQGTNLGLRTNYQGLDPNVNAFATGNNVSDTGVLPQPRTWQVRVRLTY